MPGSMIWSWKICLHQWLIIWPPEELDDRVKRVKKYHIMHNIKHYFLTPSFSFQIIFECVLKHNTTDFLENVNTSFTKLI